MPIKGNIMEFRPSLSKLLEKYPIFQRQNGKWFCKVCNNRFRVLACRESNCKHCGGKI